LILLQCTTCTGRHHSVCAANCIPLISDFTWAPQYFHRAPIFFSVHGPPNLSFNHCPYRPLSQKRLKIDAHNQRTEEKLYPSPIQLSHVYGPIANGLLQGDPKSERPNTSFEDYEPSTVSVFVSVVSCGRVCRKQSYAHSGIEPSRLAKGPKNSNFWPFADFNG